MPWSEVLQVLWQIAAYTRAESAPAGEVDRLLLAQPDGWLNRGEGAGGAGQGIEFTTTDADLLAEDDSVLRFSGCRYPVSVEYGEPAPLALSPNGTCAT